MRFLKDAPKPGGKGDGKVSRLGTYKAELLRGSEREVSESLASNLVEEKEEKKRRRALEVHFHNCKAQHGHRSTVPRSFQDERDGAVDCVELP